LIKLMELSVESSSGMIISKSDIPENFRAAYTEGRFVSSRSLPL